MNIKKLNSETIQYFQIIHNDKVFNAELCTSSDSDKEYWILEGEEPYYFDEALYIELLEACKQFSESNKSSSFNFSLN